MITFLLVAIIAFAPAVWLLSKAMSFVPQRWRDQGIVPPSWVFAMMLGVAIVILGVAVVNVANSGAGLLLGAPPLGSSVLDSTLGVTVPVSAFGLLIVGVYLDKRGKPRRSLREEATETIEALRDTATVAVFAVPMLCGVPIAASLAAPEATSGAASFYWLLIVAGTAAGLLLLSRPSTRMIVIVPLGLAFSGFEIALIVAGIEDFQTDDTARFIVTLSVVFGLTACLGMIASAVVQAVAEWFGSRRKR